MTDRREQHDLTEDELRGLLRQAVDGLAPEPGGLARIRREIPRRRARQRNTWMGAATAAVLLTAALPALSGVVEFDFTGSPAAERTSADQGPANGPTVTSSPVAAHSGGSVPDGWPSATASVTPASPTAAPSGSPTAPVAPAPACLRSDLGSAETHLAAADGSGRVYGSFTVRNTSGHSCSLTGPGAVTVSAASGTEPARIRVIDHTTGDPAAQLPDPATAAPLVLAPQAGYQVQFDWVPDTSCGASPSAAGARPQAQAAPATPLPAATASPSGGVVDPNVSPSPAGSPSAQASPTQQPAQPSVTLAHTPQAGGPVIGTAVLTGACSGTVYRAVPQAVAAPQPAPTPTG